MHDIFTMDNLVERNIGRTNGQKIWASLFHQRKSTCLIVMIMTLK